MQIILVYKNGGFYSLLVKEKNFVQYSFLIIYKTGILNQVYIIINQTLQVNYL